ncbi:TRAP transporter substrate-binding protein DctP [Oceanicella sp. SM1341]|uniref:TRAP transporter substrate-binding protein DctP n=1 Tax=Oceanicella sp. SM1341 TaxID=1548889 RepID=UPI000E4D3A5E|nr:TRAP transporter substrate-binding protein DctP [Oceanicella sp. SM1341]
MTRLNRFLRSAAIAGVLSGLAFGAAAQEVTLRAISAFPKPLYFSQSFQKFVDLVNEKGEGVVQIDFIGGPEMFPPMQQVDAVRRGVVDMQYGPATYYLGKMPEADAWVGMTVTASEARENGGFAVMQKAFSEKLNVQLLAHADTGFNFHIYTLRAPEQAADGSLDLDGFKIRSQPIYKEFFEGMGIIPVSVPVPDVYTGLERGTFDGSGWPILGIKDLSWDKFLRTRIDPGFFNSDLAVVMNPAKWEGLSDEAKQILNEAAAEYEASSTAAVESTIEATDAQVREEGMEVITLEGEARTKFLDAAYDSAWARMKASGTPYYEELRKSYYTR